MKKSLVQILGLTGIVSFLSYMAAVAFSPLGGIRFCKANDRNCTKRTKGSLTRQKPIYYRKNGFERHYHWLCT